MDLNIVFLVVFGILFLSFVLSFFLGSGKRKAGWKEKVNFKLREIDEFATNSNLSIAKSCVIEADTLLDYVFQKKRLRGATMGERLKNARGLFSKDLYQKIWDAHKYRNKLVHEVDFKLRSNDIKTHYRTFVMAIKKHTSR